MYDSSLLANTLKTIEFSEYITSLCLISRLWTWRSWTFIPFPSFFSLFLSFCTSIRLLISWCTKFWSIWFRSLWFFFWSNSLFFICFSLRFLFCGSSSIRVWLSFFLVFGVIKEHLIRFILQVKTIKIHGSDRRFPVIINILKIIQDILR
jgi:hypothetical protein